MKIRWPRLLWVVFIACYTALFFYNFFKPFENWFFIYVYTMLLVLWLCSEYYQRHNFFQSGLLLDYHWGVRAVFALFFYSSFVVGLSTTVWWPGNKIGLYPFLNILGIVLLGISVYLRWKFYLMKKYDQETIPKFYHTLYVLCISLALGYGSLFVLVFSAVIGFPLVFLQTVYEKRHFPEYEGMINGAKSYFTLQGRYRDLVKQHQAQSKKRGAT